MPRKVRNVGASVRARLLTLAQRKGVDFQLMVTRYALERLLYRLGVSPHRDRFVLKGAMLFTLWLDDPFRPTRDVDLLGFGDHDAAALKAVFREICSVAVEDDGVRFDTSRLRAAPIRDQAEYGGVRVQMAATVGGARVPLRVDIGFGDAVTPAPSEVDYPVLLDHPPPKLRAYPKETVVAEKFEAVVFLGATNTRMKDFYDLWAMSRRFAFDGRVLTSAIGATFKRRATALPADIPAALTEAFAAEKQKLWRAFTTRDRLTQTPEAFAEVVAQIGAFLLPVVAAIRSDSGMAMSWQAGGPWQPTK